MKRTLKLTLSISLFICLLTGYSSARHTVDETKKAHFTFETIPSTNIVITGGNTDVIVESWEKNVVDVTITIEFKGKETDRVRKFLDEFETEARNSISASKSLIEIKTRLDEPNKVQIGSKYFGFIIGYSDDEMRLTYEVKVPKGNDLMVKNSYKDLVIMGNYAGNVEIDHYSGDLEAGSFTDLELKLKYGDASFGNIGDAVMELYEQEIEIERLNSAKIDVKYSTVDLLEAGSIYMEAYESKITVGVAEKIKGIFKYGSLNVDEMLKTAELDIYELTLEIMKCGQLSFSQSKYSDMTIEEAGELNFFESYEDDIVIGTLGKLITKSKYLDLKVRRLTNSIKIDGYESDLNLYEYTKEASSIQVEGKYNELEINSNGIPFNLDANIKYGDIDYPEGMERKLMIKDDNLLELKLVPANRVTAKLNILIRGYEIDADID